MGFTGVLAQPQELPVKLSERNGTMSCARTRVRDKIVVRSRDIDVDLGQN